jgi:hypothetical protein
MNNMLSKQRAGLLPSLSGAGLTSWLLLSLASLLTSLSPDVFSSHFSHMSQLQGV